MSEQQGPEDLEAVRAEVDRLKEEVEKLEAKPQKRARLRKVFAVVFIVIAVLAASAITPGLWARRTVYETKRYIGVVGPLASDPAVQEALARQLTQAVFTATDMQAKVQAAIAERAPKLAFAAGPLTSSLQGFVQDQVQKLFASDQFQQFWVNANTLLQQQLVAVLDGKSEALTVQGNQVVFNYLPLLNQALQQLSGTLSALLNRTITLPTITPDTVPSQAVASLETALGVSLPDTFGSVTLFQGDELTSVQNAVSIFNKTLILAIVLFILSVILALLFSTNRRRTLLQLLTALIVVVVLERRFAIAQASNVVSMAKPENQAAVQAIIGAFLSSLLLATKRILWVLFVVLIVAVVTAPYPWAVRARAWVGDVGRAGVGAVRGAEIGPATAWVGGHRDALMLAGAVVAAIILLFATISLGWFLVLAIVLVLYELAVYRIAEASRVETAEAAG
jgi:hypothetical protein